MNNIEIQEIFKNIGTNMDSLVNILEDKKQSTKDISMSNHLMIDLETLGTTPSSFILTIGAVIFDPKNPSREITNQMKFYERISLDSYDKSIFSIDLNTISWWMEQSEEARKEAFTRKPRTDISNALIGLSKFIKDNNVKHIWSHGKDFDCVMLQGIYEKLKMQCPWKYYNTLDTRTLFHLSGVDYRTFMNLGTNDIQHHALMDCERQIKAVYMAYEKIYGKV